jgi:hypothetical protein
MKKLLIVILIFLFSPAIYSQSFWQSYRNQLGTWNKYTKKWDWDKVNYADIPIEFEKKYIRVKNKADSYFRIIEDEGEKIDYTDDVPKVRIRSYDWTAIDDKQRRCRLSLVHHESDEYDPIIFIVMYDDVVFRFYCKKNGIDSFLNQ